MIQVKNRKNGTRYQYPFTGWLLTAARILQQQQNSSSSSRYIQRRREPQQQSLVRLTSRGSIGVQSSSHATGIVQIISKPLVCSEIWHSLFSPVQNRMSVEMTVDDEDRASSELGCKALRSCSDNSLTTANALSTSSITQVRYPRHKGSITARNSQAYRRRWKELAQ